MAELSPQQLDEAARKEMGWQTAATAFFTLQAVPDSAATAAAGYPVFQERPYVMVIRQNERDHVSVLALKSHVADFPNEWRVFQDSLRSPRLPLNVLPGIRPGVIATFDALGIKTVAQLVAAPIRDGVLMREPEVITEEMLASEDDYLADAKPLCAVPPALAKWRDIAMQYIVFRAKVEGAPVPALRMIDGHLEIAGNVGAPTLAVDNPEIAA